MTVLSANNAHRSWTTLPFEVTEDGLDIELRFDSVAARGQIELDAHGLVVPASNEANPLNPNQSRHSKAGFQFGWDWGPWLARASPAPVHLRLWDASS